jgi:hypothetical protein
MDLDNFAPYQFIKAELRFRTPPFSFDMFYEFFDRMGYGCFSKHVDCILYEKGLKFNNDVGYSVISFTRMEDNYGLAPNDPRRFVYIRIDIKYSGSCIGEIIIVPGYDDKQECFLLKSADLTIYSEHLPPKEDAERLASGSIPGITEQEKVYTIVEIIQEVFTEYFKEYNSWQLEHSPPLKQWSLRNYSYSPIKNCSYILNCLRQIAGRYDECV